LSSARELSHFLKCARELFHTVRRRREPQHPVKCARELFQTVKCARERSELLHRRTHAVMSPVAGIGRWMGNG